MTRSQTIAVLSLVLGAAAPAAGQSRVDLYNTQSQREGYAIVTPQGPRSAATNGTPRADLRIPPQGARIDLYNTHSQRQGYGTVRPDGQIDLFNTNSQRQGYGVIRPR